MVLIPGLGGSDESWREAIARYRSRYQLHLVTPAGFAGVPTIEPPLLGTVESDVITYIQANSLHKPIILGHSLGAFMAFSIAAAAPDQVGPIIAIDGTPFGAALRDEHADVSNQLQRATALRDQFWNTPPEQVEAQTRKLFAPMFTNTEDLERILPDVLKSSQIALGQALYELRTTDLRKPVGAIKTPVLLIVAGQHFTDDANPDLTRYQQTMAHIADREIYVARGTRHFAMVDAPALVYGKIDSFLATRSASGDK